LVSYSEFPWQIISGIPVIRAQCAAQNPKLVDTIRIYATLSFKLRERDLCNRLARLFHADKIALQTSRDSITGEYVRKTRL